MRTVMANGCLQLRRAAPCDAVSARSRPFEPLIGTIRGLFNYIWADNKDLCPINGRKSAGFHRRLVTRMGTSSVLQPTLSLTPWHPLAGGSIEECAGGIYLSYETSQPNPWLQPGWLACSWLGRPQSVSPVGTGQKHPGFSLTSFFLNDTSAMLYLQRSALVKAKSRVAP